MWVYSHIFKYWKIENGNCWINKKQMNWSVLILLDFVKEPWGETEDKDWFTTCSSVAQAKLHHWVIMGCTVTLNFLLKYAFCVCSNCLCLVFQSTVEKYSLHLFINAGEILTEQDQRCPAWSTDAKLTCKIKSYYWSWSDVTVDWLRNLP